MPHQLTFEPLGQPMEVAEDIFIEKFLSAADASLAVRSPLFRSL